MRTEANPLLPVRSFPANGWKIVEDIAAAATFAAGQPPVFFRTRISDHQMDDVMESSTAQPDSWVVARPDVRPRDHRQRPVEPFEHHHVVHLVVGNSGAEKHRRLSGGKSCGGGNVFHDLPTIGRERSHGQQKIGFSPHLSRLTDGL